MRILTIFFLLLATSATSQVNLLLKSKNCDGFTIATYKVKYELMSDTVNIDKLVLKKLAIKSFGDSIYLVTLPPSEFWGVFFISEDKVKKIFFDTSKLTFNEPLVFTADFATDFDYYVRFDKENNTYKGYKILFEDELPNYKTKY